MSFDLGDSDSPGDGVSSAKSSRGKSPTLREIKFGRKKLGSLVNNFTSPANEFDNVNDVKP
jgi:hypothetical protein